MKTTIIKVVLSGLMLTTTVNVSGQQNKKTEKARKEVVEANKDLHEARMDSAADFREFKKEAEMNIRSNEKKIAELKAKKSSENKESKESYNKKVMALEQKNNTLKNKIERADNTQTSMWTSFKNEFNHDMRELGQAFKDIGVDNKN